MGITLHPKGDAKMSENLKIRFRLPNGEEFEAEGPQDFIEVQRAYFLNLIGRAAYRTAQTPQRGGGSIQPPATPILSAPGTAAVPPAGNAAKTPISTQPAAQPAEKPPVYTLTSSYTAQSAGGISPQVRHLWEQLLKEENGCLILRRKTRLSVQEAALLILAGAKNLLGETHYRAVLLAKSIKLSGFTPARLDRVLQGEIKAGYLTAQGSKRSRSYTLTPAGYAKAFVLAQKRVGETL